MFSSAHRAAVRADNPDVSAPEVAKLLGVKWKNLSESEQAEWKESAAVQTKLNAEIFEVIAVSITTYYINIHFLVHC